MPHVGVLHEGCAVTSIEEMIYEILEFGEVRNVHGVGGQIIPVFGCLHKERMQMGRSTGGRGIKSLAVACGAISAISLHKRYTCIAPAIQLVERLERYQMRDVVPNRMYEKGKGEIFFVARLGF